MEAFDVVEDFGPGVPHGEVPAPVDAPAFERAGEALGRSVVAAVADGWYSYDVNCVLWPGCALDLGFSKSFTRFGNVIPYPESESLRERLVREHDLPVDDAVRIATNMAEALDHAYRKGWIHRTSGLRTSSGKTGSGLGGWTLFSPGYVACAIRYADGGGQGGLIGAG